ncbi:MAG: hypothetical protein HQL31_06700, partial [Planctomycetes bacterium]|nr:hypothetical protein [Planctomycetota bacterium]
MAINSSSQDFEARLASASQNADHEVLRIKSQIEFGKGLCELHPDQAEDWLAALARAEKTVAGAAGGDLAALREAVRATEGILAPLVETAKSYTVLCVGHAHIDMNWMWSWPETVAVTMDTFRTVLRLMVEFPEFIFSQSQASCYAIVERHDPEMLDAIRKRVKEGRWEVLASHWVEGDKNLANGESLCRHLLYSRSYMKELFGLRPEDVPIDWSPDTFGHAATMPVYLSRGAVRYYYAHRLGNLAPAKPQIFTWKAPDGSTVLVRNDCRNTYNGAILAEVGQKLLSYTRESGLREMMFVYGVGDHGGGPTRRDLLRARDMQNWPVFPTLRMSTARAYFDRVAKSAKDLPVVEGELNFEFTGCYSSQSLVKKVNRLAENLLSSAETSATAAWSVLDRKYPRAGLTEAWRDTLFSQFHDILPGSGVHDTRTWTHGLFQKTAADVGQIETAALRALAAGVDTSSFSVTEREELPPEYLATSIGSGVGCGSSLGQPTLADASSGSGPRPFLVFNPAATDRRGVAQATVWDNDPRFGPWNVNAEAAMRQRPWSVLSPSGQRVAAQVVHAGQYWGHACATLAFPLEKLAAVGYGVYTVLEEKTEDASPGVRAISSEGLCAYAYVEKAEFGLENDLLRMAVDPRTGGIKSLLEKKSGLELIDPARPASVLRHAVERPHHMNAWSIAETGPVSLLEVVGIERKLSGPHIASVEVKLKREDNVFTLKYELHAGDPLLHISIEGTWVERGTKEKGVPVLRLAFPFALSEVK